MYLIYIDRETYTKDEKLCLQCFSGTDYTSSRGNIPKRTEGTLEWIFDHPKYKEWSSEDPALSSSHIWISGSPGCGVCSTYCTKVSSVV